MEALSVTAYAVPALPKGELFASDGKGFLLMRSDILLHQLIKLPPSGELPNEVRLRGFA